MDVRYLIATICLVLFHYSNGQVEEIQAITSAATVSQENPTGDADGGSGPPPDTGGGVTDNGVGGITPLSFGAGGRSFGRGRPRRPRSYICPAYSLVSQNTCPGPNRYCPTRICYRFATTAYYYGLPFTLHTPVWIKGSFCRNERMRCDSTSWATCRCRTKFCWLPLRRVIRHDLKLYFLRVYLRRPCGCNCVGRSTWQVAPAPIIHHPAWDFQ